MLPRVLSVATALLFGCCTCFCRSETKPPNILLILCDDLGYGDLGVFFQNTLPGAHKLLTPECDRLAQEGLQLSSHYASAPVCKAEPVNQLADIIITSTFGSPPGYERSLQVSANATLSQWMLPPTETHSREELQKPFLEMITKPDDDMEENPETLSVIPSPEMLDALTGSFSEEDLADSEE